MVEASDEPSLLDRIRSSAHALSLGIRSKDESNVLPLSNNPGHDASTSPSREVVGATRDSSNTHGSAVDNGGTTLPPPAPPPTSKESMGNTLAPMKANKKPNVVLRFYHTSKDILFSSIFNLLLVFVPVGIALGNVSGANPIAVFTVNAVAIIPLAGLLAHATEAVAASLGDTIGALLNVTFGNAVELIIFIALVKNEIRIVQASIIGSILANLLLILGMCFLFGGLLFREQIYNSTVTQMSACLLSLSATSLLLPTAFHASFNDSEIADAKALQLSRASSIILLLIYILYLVFQLKSHAYMYESTPQHVIDEESYPGVLANIMDSSSSSDTTSNSDSEGDDSSGSHTTAKRIRRAFRGRRARKSSVSSNDTPSLPSTARTPSLGTFAEITPYASPTVEMSNKQLGAIASGDEADIDGKHKARRQKAKTSGIISRDFENEKGISSPSSKASPEKRRRQFKKRHSHKAEKKKKKALLKIEDKEKSQTEPIPNSHQPHVTFEAEDQADPESSPRRPFTIRTLSVRPAMPKILTSTVFSATNPTGPQAPAGVAVPRAPYGLRRTTSLPDRLYTTQSATSAQQEANLPRANTSQSADESTVVADSKEYMSRTSAVILLLCSTALVALCAEYLVDSINYLVDSTSVSQAFIGLIILPIVGNAAEHVTAVTVASKNKMDLAIGVAIGSSIQIALFVTPAVILLGWIMNKEMSLYFSLFETVSLFVSAFIINFLILDGRSNYLEGALLIAAYVIIAVAAFFYPNVAAESGFGGPASNATDVAASTAMQMRSWIGL